MKPKTYPYIILLAGLPKGIAEDAVAEQEKYELAQPKKRFYTNKVWRALLHGFYWNKTTTRDFYFWFNLWDELDDLDI